MAVWIYAYGKNGMYGKDVSIERCADILNAIPLDGTKLLDGIHKGKYTEDEIAGMSDSWKEVAIHFNESYSNFESKVEIQKWTSRGDHALVYKLYDSLPHLPRVGLVVVFRNDLLWITGPSEVFSKYFIFLKELSKDLREYYHSYFKQIMKALGSNFILYAHEWSCLDDDEDENPDFDYEKLRQQVNWEKDSSDSIHTMKDFYYEALQ